ncbi:hypothetical protein THASP1DRAFT_33165 [Thamnocephalis sphaerospora]|uniref:Uncharacterized protein n=1 Tax=Thamnocephalis sphaerospora TaxID=78915 RepID=A0A4P9XH75_9FUNG|nr:hypothetical protein THASP1DRAFT_33165 [Thamnocephalis sphaerospora]|eukprot:RKP05013.1 hypothetical protein THASP1DRAFT_33165 [Thamnocephalis sphaerospora]
MEQERSELQDDFDAQPPASLDLVYFNDLKICVSNEPQLFDELQVQLQQHRGQYPHIEEIYSVARHAIGWKAGYRDHYDQVASWNYWTTLVVPNKGSNPDFVAYNMVYKVMRKEPLDFMPRTKVTIIHTMPKSIVVYMAGLDKETKNMHWRLLEIFTNRPTKIISSGVVRLDLQVECNIGHIFPIVDRGSKRVDRVGVCISLKSGYLPVLYKVIVHDISATTITATDTPVPPLLSKTIPISGMTRLPGGFAFVQNNQLVCSADEQTHCTKVSDTICLSCEPLLGHIFSASEKPGRVKRLLLFDGQNGTRLPFSLEDCPVRPTGISSHATGFVRVIDDRKAVEVYSFGAE